MGVLMSLGMYKRKSVSCEGNTHKTCGSTALFAFYTGYVGMSLGGKSVQELQRPNTPIRQRLSQMKVEQLQDAGIFDSKYDDTSPRVASPRKKLRPS